MDGLYLVQDSTLHLSTFVQTSIYVAHNIIKTLNQLVKRKRVNLLVIKKQSFKWKRRKAAIIKKQSFEGQILFAKIEGVNFANLRWRIS